jgi:sulfur transfer protein SufE
MCDTGSEQEVPKCCRLLYPVDNQHPMGNIQFFLDMDNIMLNGYGEILVWVYPVQRQPYIIGTDKNYHIGHTKTKKYVFRDCLTLGLKLYWASPKEHTLLPIF